ncbi:MAG: hypothetical protein CSYNP_01844 [Syntrophus sp. SKADARSKE-3]|nr:hypothetical protein [Syntrophus sp. SKADARSKE-3]
MSKSNSVRLSVVTAILAMTVFVSGVNAQAPGVRERSEDKRDKQSVNAGTSRKAESEHNEKMKSAKKAADEYKSSKKDAKAKQKYQDAKEKGGW